MPTPDPMSSIPLTPLSQQTQQTAKSPAPRSNNSIPVACLVVFWIGWLGGAARLTKDAKPDAPKVWGAITGAISGVTLVIIILILVRRKLTRSRNDQTQRPKRQRDTWISWYNRTVIVIKARFKWYNRNLGNTVIVILFSIIVLPILYSEFWHLERNRQVITLERGSVPNTSFPSITFFQQSDWSVQADLDISTPPKCFIGRYDEGAPDCGTVPAGSPCKCHDRWADELEYFEWQNTTYRTLSLIPSEFMVSVQPTDLMIAQASFLFNSTKAREDGSGLLSPSLWIAIYDPTLPVVEALEAGYSQLRLINANGMTNINIGLHRRQAPNRQPAYDYELSFSSIPAMEIQCDVSSPGGATGNCHARLYLQFPTFERLSAVQAEAMSWADLVSLVGSWFALFQLAGWILSGTAWHRA